MWYATIFTLKKESFHTHSCMWHTCCSIHNRFFSCNNCLQARISFFSVCLWVFSIQKYSLHLVDGLSVLWYLFIMVCKFFLGHLYVRVLWRRPCTSSCHLVYLWLECCLDCQLSTSDDYLMNFLYCFNLVDITLLFQSD